jgi:hypothetical protein
MATDPVVPPSKVPKKRGPKKEVNDIRRRRVLEADEFTEDITPTSVKCNACGQTIQLDDRGAYYEGAWKNHCLTCTPQRQRLLNRRAEVIVISYLFGSIQGMI